MCIRIVKTYEKTFIKTLKSNFAKNQVQWTHSCLITLFQWRFESVSHHSSDKTGDILHTARFSGTSGMFLITKYLNHGHKTKIYFWGRRFISWLWIKRPRGSEFDINVILNLTGWLKTGKKPALNRFTGFTLCGNKRKLKSGSGQLQPLKWHVNLSYMSRWKKSNGPVKRIITIL